MDGDFWGSCVGVIYFQLISKNCLLFGFEQYIRIKMEQKNVPKYQPTSTHTLEPSTSKIISTFSTPPSILSNNFFQVTVNSEKLTCLFHNIDEIIFEQNRKMERLSKELGSVFGSLQEKFQAQSRKNGLLFTKLDLRINESANAQHCYLMDVHRKAEQRDQELGKRIDTATAKIGKVQDNLKDDLQTGLLALKKQIIGDVQVQNPKKEQNSVEPTPKPITKPRQSIKIDFNYLIKHFNEEMETLRQSIIPTFSELYELKQQQKKKKHTQDMLDLTYKRDLQSTKQNFKQDQNMMRVLYPSGKKANSQKQSEQKQIPHKLINKMTRHMSFTKNIGIEEQIISSYAQIVEKLQKIQQTCHQQTLSISQLKNKQIILDEKTTIFNRKLDKNCFEIAQIKTNFRRNESQKFDDKVIEELRHYIKWVIRDLEQKINKKCSDQDLTRQKNKLSEKISILHENLIEKADKGQIQKALLFLQNKIKQIIFLIAAQHTEQKQGAIMKVAAKCLSCDKEVERQLESQAKCRRELNKNTQGQGQYIKSMTHRVRQRYRKEMAHTVGNQTFDD